MNGKLSSTFTPRTPILLEWPDGSALVERLSLTIDLEGAWYTKRIHFDADTAVYDWARRVFRLSGQGGQIQLSGIDFDTGRRVIEPPQRYLSTPVLQAGEVYMNLAMYEGFPAESYPLPELEALLPALDLEWRIDHIPPDAYRSRLKGRAR